VVYRKQQLNPFNPTATLLEHALLAQGFMGVSSGAERLTKAS
jgi:hypothetical protein